ncbi:hypothetical protein [Acetobacterium carbinolicum]|uniref:hypothetical protein n=1 Tax=Acetobacterium carbinolicum TaxID=52690 RepID=UPI0039C8DBB6
MIAETRIQYALDHFIAEKYFDSRGKCNFVRPDKNIGMKKSVDHLIFRKIEDQWELHLIEMKSSIGDRKWIEIKQKFRASYLNAKAIAVFVGITIDKVILYTTYEKAYITGRPSGTTDLKSYAPKLGEKLINIKKEWDTGIVELNFGHYEAFQHTKIKMTRSDDQTTLLGEYTI